MTLDLGFLRSGLLTGLREGVEAALIVSIILAYLAKTGNQRHFGTIWLGAGAAIALSVVIGVILFVTIGGFEEPAEQIFEGFAMILAATVVTWMLFWMRRTVGEHQGRAARRRRPRAGRGRHLRPRGPRLHRGHPRGHRDRALPDGPGDGRRHARPRSTLVGALVGLAIAVVIGYGALPRRASHQPAHLLPVDRHRPDLHRGRPAVARHPRVRRGRLDHDRHRHRVRHQRRPAARARRRGPLGVVGSILRALVRLHAARRSGSRSSPGSPTSWSCCYLYTAAGAAGGRPGDDAGAATGRRLTAASPETPPPGGGRRRAALRRPP